jgi:acetyl-CoA carboxylase biotin carboxylase subunit
MRRVFIPNRGEIAVRIVGACRALDLECVVGASAADMDGMAARGADLAVCIGPGPAADSYLRPDIVVQAAIAAGCDAIHPGYGFLSESPRLARLARENDLIFVGPPTEAIELAGDTLGIRAQAARARAPVLAAGRVANSAEVHELAAEIGYPLVVRNVDGGPERWIKRVNDDDELDALLARARRETGGTSGDVRMYLERLIAPARCVEVQIAVDEHGQALHLGERDCSVRQHGQTVVAEAPAPSLTPATSDELGEWAVALAQHIGYRNLGTAAFAVDAHSGEPYFSQLSCSIQPDHPLTEAVTGLDLVAMQLRIAAGHRLDLAQEDVRVAGHAIECRLNAEDPAHGYAPTPGRLSLFSVPERDGLRVDTYCRPGATVPPYYDPLLAKLIAHAGDRDQASDILLDALEDLDVEGVETNRTLLISVLGHPDFRAGRATTDWLERAIR